jgi:hypothetical protein
LGFFNEAYTLESSSILIYFAEKPPKLNCKEKAWINEGGLKEGMAEEMEVSYKIVC